MLIASWTWAYCCLAAASVPLEECRSAFASRHPRAFDWVCWSLQMILQGKVRTERKLTWVVHSLAVHSDLLILGRVDLQRVGNVDPLVASNLVVALSCQLLVHLELFHATLVNHLLAVQSTAHSGVSEFVLFVGVLSIHSNHLHRVIHALDLDEALHIR